MPIAYLRYRSSASPLRQWSLRTKPLRGGEDRDLDKRSASATAPPALTSLVAWIRAPRRALLRHGDAEGWFRFLCYFAAIRGPSQTGPRNRRSIDNNAKAVPVGASTSADLSPRPTELRSKDALTHDRADTGFCKRRAQDVAGRSAPIRGREQVRSAPLGRGKTPQGRGRIPRLPEQGRRGPSQRLMGRWRRSRHRLLPHRPREPELAGGTMRASTGGLGSSKLAAGAVSSRH
jgi:hypothetical protein